MVATGTAFPNQTGEEELMDIVHGQDVEEQEEPEGPRMTRLRGILDKSLKETLKACNYAAICECFPALAAANPRDLREAHEKVCQFLNIEVNNEFEQIIKERNVIFKLNGLDRLIADARGKGNTAGSRTILDLSPEVAVRARTVPTKEAEIERLKAELERVQLDNRRIGGALNHSKAEQAAIKLELLESYNEFQEDTMSKTPAELDALRAAVLMTRRQPAQTTQIASNVEQSAPETSSERSTMPVIDSSINLGPSVIFAPVSTETSNLNTYPTPLSTALTGKASPSTLGSLTVATSATAHVPTTYNTTNKPSNGAVAPPKTHSSQPTDREDGEISDEELGVKPETETEHDLESAASRSRVSDTRSNQPTGLTIEAQTGAIPAPLPLHGRPQLPSHQALMERVPRYTQRLLGTIRPSITTNTATSKGKSKSLDIGGIKLGQDPDFNSLIEEYQLQKAKSDSKSHPAATNQDQTLDSEIPGLGHLKTLSPDFSLSDRNFRRQPNIGRRPGDQVRQLAPRNQRGDRVTKRRSRDMSLNIKQQPTPPVHHEMQRHRSDPNPGFVTLSPQTANGQINDFTQVPPTHQASSQGQIYSLVEELLSYGVTPEYLLQSGIDPAVVYHVSSTRTPLASPIVPVGPTQGFHLNPQALAVASMQLATQYPQPSASAPISQPFIPQFGQVHQQPHLTGYSMRDTSMDVSQPQSIQQQHTQVQQTPQTIPQQLCTPTPTAIVSEDDASRKLEMILAYAAKILPQGWHSLVPQGGTDTNVTPVNVESLESARGLDPASTPYQDNAHEKAPESLRAVKVEQDGDRWAPLKQNLSQENGQIARPGWNLSEEARFTTAKFQDLSISPNQQMQNQQTTISSTTSSGAHISVQSIDTSPSLKQHNTEELRPINNDSMSTKIAPPSVLYERKYPRDNGQSHDTGPSISTASTNTSRSPSRPPPPPPPAHPPPSPPPPPTSAPPSPPTSTPPTYSPHLELGTGATSESLSSKANLESNRSNVLDNTMPSNLNNIDHSRSDNDESINLFYLDSVPKEQNSTEVGSQRGSSASLDDTDMDIDIDDDSTEPTILKGSWKTTEDIPPTTPASSTQPVPKRPTHIRFDRMGNTLPSPVHSASMLTTSTQADNQDANGHFLPTVSRPQRNGRRVTAKDFMLKPLSSTPFIQERALSYLIDIDDEDDDEYEPRVDTPTAKSSTPISRADSINSPQESRTLQDIQQQLKELNERILAKQRAKRSALSASATDGSTPKNTPTGLTSRSETGSPAQPSGSSSNSEDQMMEKVSDTNSIGQEAYVKAEELRRTINEHKASLEGLRSQKQQYEQDRTEAMNLLADALSSNANNQDYGKLQRSIDEAAEKVAIKMREFEDAKRHLEEIKARTGPILSQQSDLQKTKERLQGRIDLANEKTAGLKSSIGSLQQNIIQMRTQLMILEGKYAPKLDATNSEACLPSTPNTNSTTQDINSDTVPKRGIDPQGQTPPMNAKKPRTQAREEFSALSKRMQELEREKDLLRSASAPSTVTNGISTVSIQQPGKTNTTQLPSLYPSPHGSVPSHSKVNLGVPAGDGNVAPAVTSKTLSRLDEFLAQDKSLPITPVADNDNQSPSPSGRPTAGIKKLYLAESCLFELDQLCMPSELIKYVIPDRQNGSQVDSSAVLYKPSASDSKSSKDALDYVSPLSMFRSFRFSPRFRDAVRDGYKSLTYSNKIDPMKPMCLYELSGGSCNDDSCKSQHARDYELTDEELVIDMARYAEGNTPESRQVFAEMQSAKLAHLRAAGIHNVELLVDSIVKNHRDFVQDSSRTVKFGERIVTDNDATDSPATRNKPKGHSGSRAVDRLVESSKASFNSLDQSPISMVILSKALTGSLAKNRRYHEQRHPDNFEKQVLADPSNETLWIEYAISHLSTMSVDETNGAGDHSIHNALSVLSRALGVHPSSENLWGLYLDLYTRHGAESETRQMFEQCLHYVPDAQLIWFRYFLWEKDRDERVYVLDRMLERACQEPRKADDEAARSRFTLDVVLQIVKTMVSENFVESAKNWMQNFLTCTAWESIVPSSLSYAQLDDVWIEQDMVENIAGTLAAKLLKPNDHCILWLAFVYLIWFHELPDQLFQDYPNGYISDNSLFVIHWPEIEEPEQESELHSIVHDIFLGLTVYFVDCDARSPLVATVKNFVGFLIARGQQQEEILELVNPSQFPESFPEIRDLFCQVRMPAESKQACLEQCAYEFFKVESSHEVGIGRSELALRLYRKLLGLSLPYSYEAPVARSDITSIRTNVFMWLNYLSLLALGSGSYSQLEAAFSSAMEALPADKISVIQTEFAIHSIMKELHKATNASAINSLVAMAISDINILRPNPYDHSVAELTKVLALRDFSQLNRIIEAVWNRTVECSRQLQVDLVDSFLRLHPENPDFYLWLITTFAGPGSQGSMDLILKASLFSPLAAKLSRMPTIHDVSKQLKSMETEERAHEEKALDNHNTLESQGFDSGSDMDMDDN
ncbi:Zinc finger C3H1 domain-containing protein [Entomortierella chlamydospora]|uniref:Zinc finger C3H1 domain-containing protein n=1 Tax=Entomortierella chlamydospora TaxID=101097 RepID=A0A9P6N2C0_9FUNG|nr:Zinc finger C3H1 domain-containing protein [Entomortierella chlamydospora]